MNNSKCFSVCITNPPYGKLHLKFLSKMIETCDEVISIQPVRWLEDQTAPYMKRSDLNKYKESIADHIRELSVISAEDIKKYFNILFVSNIGIYVCDEEGGFDYESFFSNDIVKKVVAYIQQNKCIIDRDKKEGYRVRVPLIIGGRAIGSGEMPPMLVSPAIKDIVFKDGKYNDKWWYEYYGTNQHSKTTEDISASIRFESEEEGHNFAKSLKTEFGRYIEDILIDGSNVSNSKILWMGNAKHPRTGLTGYRSEWTNEDFYTFFNIDDSFQKMIEEKVHNIDIEYREWMEEHKKKKK